MKYTKLFIFVLLAGFLSCTDLNEKLNEDLTRVEAEAYLNDNADVSSLLRGAYDGLRLPYQDQSRFWAAQQHTSDQTLGPTRGPDWDDNGIWRVLHDHTWTAEHAFLSSTFTELLQVVFSTTNVLTFNTTPQEAAEARYLRAFIMYSIAVDRGCQLSC